MLVGYSLFLVRDSRIRCGHALAGAPVVLRLLVPPVQVRLLLVLQQSGDYNRLDVGLRSSVVESTLEIGDWGHASLILWDQTG